MKIDKELIENVSRLARLDLEEDEKKQFVSDFKEILDTFSKIDKADTSGVKASFQPVNLRNKMREDLVEESLSQEDALKNTEHKKDGYFKGPRAI